MPQGARHLLGAVGPSRTHYLLIPTAASLKSRDGRPGLIDEARKPALSFNDGSRLPKGAKDEANGRRHR